MVATATSQNQFTTNPSHNTSTFISTQNDLHSTTLQKPFSIHINRQDSLNTSQVTSTKSIDKNNNNNHTFQIHSSTIPSNFDSSQMSHTSAPNPVVTPQQPRLVNPQSTIQPNPQQSTPQLAQPHPHPHPHPPSQHVPTPTHPPNPSQISTVSQQQQSTHQSSTGSNPQRPPPPTSSHNRTNEHPHDTRIRTATGTFNGNTHLADSTVQTAPQFSFEDPNRTRQTVPTSMGHNPVVFQLPSGEYIAQTQDGINDGRGRGLSIGETIQHPTFDNTVPTSIVPQNIPYDNDIDRRLPGPGVTNNDGILTSNSLDQTNMGRASAFVTNRTNRLSNDGRPLGNANFAHSTIEKRVTCEHCGQLFGDVNSLKRHSVRQHRENTGKDPVYCGQCNAMLKNEQNLRRHIAVCHSGTQEHRCEMCTASFSSRGSLRIHQQNVHHIPSNSRNRGGRGGRGGRGRPGRINNGITKNTKAEKSYVCDLCPETFKWKGNLKRHRELRHLQLRPFVCTVCQASFGTKSNMRVHMITHSNASQK